MSDFALQFVPAGEKPPSPFAMGFVPTGLDGREMSMQERIEAAKAGTLAMQPGSAERAAAADAATGIDPPQGTSLLEQAGSGVNEGLASFAGLPSMLADATGDALTSGINAITGSNLATSRDLPPELQNRIGTPQRYIQDATTAGLISDAPPENAPQRYARRVGREVGFGAPAAALTGGGANLLMANMLADTAAGVAGQTAREVAPENDTLDAIVSILAGGGTAATMSRPKKPPAPYSSTDEMFEASSRIRGNPADTIDNIPATGLHASREVLTSEGQQALFDRLYARAVASNASPDSHPQVFKMLENAKNRSVARAVDIDELRQIIGNDLAGSTDPALRRVGVKMKTELDKFLRQAADSDRMATPGFRADVDALEEARRLEHQGYKAGDVERGSGLAINRASRAGRGGNEVNTMQQNVGKILDNEVFPARNKHPHGYTPDEVAQMSRIAGPDKPASLRFGRHVAGMSPTTGALPMMSNVGANIAGVTGATLTGNPFIAAASAAPAITGLAAKGLTEHATRAQIDELIDIIRRGGTAAGKELSQTDAAKRIAALLSATDSAGPR